MYAEKATADSAETADEGNQVVSAIRDIREIRGQLLPRFASFV